jgi:hypothetical protein
MIISTAGIKLIACGALVAVGLTVGSGAAHAVAPDPTADQCLSFAQIAVDEGETLAQELADHGFNPAGCPAGPPVVVGTCVLGHNTVTGEHCYTEGYSDPKDRPDGYPIPDPKPAPAADCRDKIDYDSDYDCTQPPSAVATGDSSNAPVVEAAVKGVTVSNAAAAPAALAAAAPAKAATLSTPVLAAAAAPAATTKALPVTGGDITGLVLLAFAGLGIGGALRLFDKRRRTA